MRRSADEIARRQSRLPRPEFPPDLPISQKRDEIARAIAAHQVVIVCGETGSGKTTQLPKICLALGRGVQGLIGHTQPRRIAARATASRIAEELHTELGKAVGYKIRFTDQTSRDGYIKLMTDGILLAETQNDPTLSQYDTLIIDEAHERSLNIDFLLGYVKQLLPRRPDLKLIITSATIDAQRFARQFGDAPVVEVSGRLYPVEVRYRQPEEDDDGSIDLAQSIADAIDDLAREGAGDVLVFLPGEREIREAAEVLRGRDAPNTEVVPLYARLSAAEQERVFRAHKGRRIVLATNVAETSLTVPGIRFVVDTGLARVKRYSYRNKVEQLQIERISQAAAKQRAGRCGRVASGVCVRLYDEEDFAKRPAYTDPEVLRSSLAAVILRMKALGLGAIESFPFIAPPAPRAIADGYALLHELGALDVLEGEAEAKPGAGLTEIGRQLARLPVDPRIGRMVLAARAEGSLNEVLVIAAALAVQDPRERPLERAQAADEAQKKFTDERSDFIALLKLWSFFAKALRELSGRKLQALCRQHFVSFNRLREWRDIVGQLTELLGELDAKIKVEEPSLDPARYAIIHRAVLTGLLGNIGLKGEEGPYLGARGIKFYIHPGSGLGKKAPRWVMAAELTETTRLFARTVAGIEPQWLEQIGSHLIKRSQAEPHWEKKPAQVMALERGVLYGIPVYVNRRVPFGPIDPDGARKIFIREALVQGDFESRAPFYVHNRRLLHDIQELEHKSRRPDVLVDEELIYAFYDDRIPDGVWSDAKLTAWRSKAEAKDPKLLFLKREELMRHEAAGITTAQFPTQIELAGRAFALEYLHDPGGARDGVTMTVPLIALNQLSAARLEWLVPGLLREKVIALTKSLPQRLRHRLGTLGDFADDFIAATEPADAPLIEALTRFIRTELNLQVPLDGFRLDALPAHLQMNIRVIDEHGRQLAIGRNLAQLRGELGRNAGERFSEIAQAGTPANETTSWTFGALEEVMEISRGSETLIGYPAIVDSGAAVRLEVMDSPQRARTAHREGLRKLFQLQLKDQARFLEKTIAGNQPLTLQLTAFGDVARLRTHLVAAVIERACMNDPWPTDANAFAKRLDEGRTRLNLIGQEIVRLIGQILAEAAALRKKLAGLKAFAAVVRDVEEQLARLLPADFVLAIGYERLAQYPRYFNAIGLRLDKLRNDPTRDQRLHAELVPLEREWLREQVRTAKSGEQDPQLEQFRWLLEELRVSLFAQELKTPVPVSVKRLARMWQTIQR